MLADNGALAELINAEREFWNVPVDLCIGMGQAPSTGAVSLRTFNRNFYGRSGTASADVYLCSPEVAAVSALRGEITDPRILEPIVVNQPERYLVNDNLIVPPLPFDEAEKVEIIKGPNIKRVSSE